MFVYELYDVYDCPMDKPELLGTFDTLGEVRKACRERDEDTDGEWSCEVLLVSGSGHATVVKNFLW